jgi:transglutaminase-like putative cysteine protease
MATQIAVTHNTTYRYDRPVTFGEHRFLIRPRDAHDLRVLDANLAISPSATLLWSFDQFGNSVARATFSEASDHLEVRSELLITLFARDPSFRMSGMDGAPMPVAYSADQIIDLTPYRNMEFGEEGKAVREWLDQAFINRPTTDLSFLTALSALIKHTFLYRSRDELGTQTALETIKGASGTCRDFAFLFMECARLFGFAARFVTGYLFDRADGSGLVVGGGATHAWAEIYVPGHGWIEFDPTNLISDGMALIRVAVTRAPAQASPISGTFDGGEGAQFLGMTVDVSVREVAADM